MNQLAAPANITPATCNALCGLGSAGLTKSPGSDKGLGMQRLRDRTHRARQSQALRTLLVLGSALAFCWVQPLRAAINTADTVEWLTCEAQVVAVGKIDSVSASKGPGEVVYEDCVLHV